MSTQNPLPSGGVPLPPTPTQLQQSFDHGIWYALTLWPALHVAIANSWGGPSSADKKDWFAGAISDLFASRPDTDQEDLEAFLVQVMQDEFECNVEDESEVVVAGEILGLRRCLRGEMEGCGGDRLAVFKELERRYQNRGQMKADVKVIDNGPQEVDDDEDWDEEDEDEDVDMEAAEGFVPNVAPAIAQQPKQKAEPEVDEDGFTKVTKKGRR
jgi:pre-rRNA-processing protein TSR2